MPTRPLTAPEIFESLIVGSYEDAWAPIHRNAQQTLEWICCSTNTSIGLFLTLLFFSLYLRNYVPIPLLLAYLFSIPSIWKVLLSGRISGLASKYLGKPIGFRSPHAFCHLLQGIIVTNLMTLEIKPPFSFLIEISVFFLLFGYTTYNTVKRTIRYSKIFWESSFFHNQGDFCTGMWLGLLQKCFEKEPCLYYSICWQPILLEHSIYLEIILWLWNLLVLGLTLWSRRKQLEKFATSDGPNLEHIVYQFLETFDIEESSLETFTDDEFEDEVDQKETAPLVYYKYESTPPFIATAPLQNASHCQTSI